MEPLLTGIGFITGAASGIGKATASSFAKHGARGVVVADINLRAAEATVGELGTKHPSTQFLAVQLDVASEASLAAAIEVTVQRFGRVDYAVNNAGIAGPFTPSAEVETSAWQRMIDVMLTGVWMSSRAELRQMLKQDPLVQGSPRYHRGVIVNVSSMFGILAGAPQIPTVAYTAAKHGVLGVTKADAVTYAERGIRINAICPGYVGTPLFNAATSSDTMQEEINRTPMRRMAEMDEVADCITFLVSPLSSFVCGTSLVVDGGHVLQ